MQTVRAEVDSQRHLVGAFEGLTVGSHVAPQVPEGSQLSMSQRVWLGYVMKDGLDEEYVEARDALADAAYIGNWQVVKEYIQRGEDSWGETWANAFRLRQFILTCSSAELRSIGFCCRTEAKPIKAIILDATSPSSLQQRSVRNSTLVA